MARKISVHKVDFNALENKANSYRSLNSFQKELVDHMVALSSPAAGNLSLHQQATLNDVYDVMESLTARQQEVLKLSFGLGDDEPLTEQTIAKQLGITQQGVHDIKSRAIKAIQRAIKPAVSEKATKNPQK